MGCEHGWTNAVVTAVKNARGGMPSWQGIDCPFCAAERLKQDYDECYAVKEKAYLAAMDADATQKFAMVKVKEATDLLVASEARRIDLSERLATATMALEEMTEDGDVDPVTRIWAQELLTSLLHPAIREDAPPAASAKEGGVDHERSKRGREVRRGHGVS